MTDSDNAFGFDPVPESLTETPVTPPKPPKKSKKQTPEGEPAKPKERGTVTLVAANPDGDLLSGDNFSIFLESVSGRVYNFQDLSEANKWITRRLYNGEQVSEPVILLNDILSNRRPVYNLKKLVGTIQAYAKDFDPAKSTVFSRATPLIAKLTPLVQPIDDTPEPLSELRGQTHVLLESLTHAQAVVKPQGDDEGKVLAEWTETCHNVTTKILTAAEKILDYNPTFNSVSVFSGLQLPETPSNAKVEAGTEMSES